LYIKKSVDWTVQVSILYPVMPVEKLKDLAADLRRIYSDLKSMETKMSPSKSEGREIDIDQVIDHLNTFKLSVTYLRLKADELVESQNIGFSEVREEVHYFVIYLKHAADTFNEISNSLTYGGRGGDEAAIQKTSEEIYILQRHLHEMNERWKSSTLN